MAEGAHPEVGPKIRAIRERRGYSLRALSKLSGLSTNAISRIERCQTSPTVSTLHRLAMALGVPITEFFETADRRATVFVRPDQRKIFRGGGIIMESLGIGLPGQQLEPFLIKLEPGIYDSSTPIVHGGEEFVFCLEGEIEYQIGGKKHRMTKGDSLLFQATQPHLCQNVGDATALLFLIFQTSNQPSQSRKKHLGK